MNAKATKTSKGSKSSHKPNVEKAAQGAPETRDAQAVETSAPDAPVAPESAQVAKRAGKRPKGEATLAELTHAYLAHLEAADKSPGTVFSYRMDLAAALEHFGEDTPVSSLTPQKVANFFESDIVRKKRNGRVKSAITVAKTRRVFRLALVWAAENGLIEKAPIPADELEYARGSAKAEKPESSKAARKSGKASTKKGAKAASNTKPGQQANAAPAEITPAQEPSAETPNA